MATGRDTADAKHRARLADHLDEIGRNLSDMLTYWTSQDLPADFLAVDQYPFRRSLEDQTAEVFAAAGRIRAVDEED